MQQLSFMGRIREWIWGTTKNQKMILFGQIILLSRLILEIFNYDRLLEIIVNYQNKAIPKAILGIVFVVFIPEITKAVYGRFKDTDFNISWSGAMKQARKVIDNEFVIDGVAQVDELIEFMIDQSGLPVTQMKKYFNITNEGVKKLGDNLTRMGILKKGPSNSRILATNDIDYMVEVLTSAKDSDHIFYKDSPTSTMLQNNLIGLNNENPIATA